MRSAQLWKIKVCISSTLWWVWGLVLGFTVAGICVTENWLSLAVVLVVFVANTWLLLIPVVSVLGIHKYVIIRDEDLVSTKKKKFGTGFVIGLALVWLAVGSWHLFEWIKNLSAISL